MFVPKIDDGMPVRQTALLEIDRVVSERLGRARVAKCATSGTQSTGLAKRVGTATKPLRRLMGANTSRRPRWCSMGSAY
jgi:hypothetical protein